MSLELDEETLEALGWGDDIEAERMPSFQRAVPKSPRQPRFDGRHRRNWRRKAIQSPETARPERNGD